MVSLAGRSGVEIRDEFALEASDLILEHEFATFQSFDLQLVDAVVQLQTNDDVIEIPMFNS